MAGDAGVCSVKTKYKYKINLNKNGFCCKSKFKPRIGLRQFNGNMAYRGGMIIYIFALLLVSLRCCWSGRVGSAGRADLVVFAQLSHQAAYSNILSNGRANIPTAARPRSVIKSPSPCYRLTGHLLITILLAGDVHLNPGPVLQSWTKATFAGYIWVCKRHRITSRKRQPICKSDCNPAKYYS